MIVFLVLSALIIISNNDLALYDDENLDKFGELYLGWIDKIYVNMQGITGEVVQREWLPK